MEVDRRGIMSAAMLGLGMASAGALKAAPASDKSASHTAPAGKWLIAMEETCVPPGLAEEYERNLAELNIKRLPAMTAKLLDFRGKRLEEMDACGIDIQVVAPTIPSPQQLPDPAKAERLARLLNDAMAQEVAKTPGRFIAFASLSMHNPDAACRELERSVRDLGMRGVLLNNFQWVGEGGQGALFFDDPRFDPFWSTLETLNVPFYLHPGPVSDAGGRRQDYAGVNWLKEATWEWGSQTGFHALRIITTGVFDRHPKAQMILGHGGEHIIGDLWRIDNRIARDLRRYQQSDTTALRAKRGVLDYFKSNVMITTSGQFSSLALEHAIKAIGADRIMFAVDYPYEDNTEGADWFKSVDLAHADRLAIGRNNAARILKL